MIRKFNFGQKVQIKVQNIFFKLNIHKVFPCYINMNDTLTNYVNNIVNFFDWTTFLTSQINESE